MEIDRHAPLAVVWARDGYATGADAARTNHPRGGIAGGVANVPAVTQRFGRYGNGAGSSGSVALGSRIGTDKTGMVAPGNTRGGTAAGAANTSAAHGRTGVWIGGPVAGPGSTVAAMNNLVAGNFIGPTPGAP